MGQMLSCPWYSQVQGPFLASVWTSWQAQGSVPAGEYPARASFSKATLSKEHLLRQTRPQGDQVSHSQSFSYRHSHTGPQKPTLRVGGGGLLCYMERLSPLSENKDLPLGMPTSDLCLSSSTDRAGAQGGQVALFGITGIALRCSGTLKMTLSQPGQARPIPPPSCHA